MQIFDFYINPKSRRDLFFKSFCFGPETKQEKILGNLYIIAELANSISKDAKILDELADVIKREFYARLENTPEDGLREALRKGNQYLDNLTKQGNVRWLGNLNIVVFNIKESVINFSKTGDIKLLLLRGNEYLDISENLEFQSHSAVRPFQSFSNIASGHLATTDKIIALTKNIFDFFHAELAQDLIALSEPDSKNINKILGQKKEKMKNSSGILFFVSMKENYKKRFGLSLPRLSLPSLTFSKEFLFVIGLILILFFCFIIFKLKK